MIERSKSFSKGGNIIERVMEIERYSIDREKLSRILSSKSTQPNQSSKQTISIEGFNKVTGRDKPSPFLIHHTRDNNQHLNYENKKDTIMTR